MIFRLTQKLAEKIKVVPQTALPPHIDPFLDWTAHLFMISRWQTLIVTNSRSLYSVIIPGKGVSSEQSFVEQVMIALRQYMIIDETISIFDDHIAPASEATTFCKASDRRVLGSMNDLIHNARTDLLETLMPFPLMLARLNEMPMSLLGYGRPRDVFLLLSDRVK